MQYLGGKARIVKHIAPLLTAHATASNTYWEPFLGGGSVAAVVAPYFSRAVLSDAHPDLMLLWAALAEGWEPPAAVSEEEYRALRSSPPSPLRSFAGFGASFGGKWFGGYARPHPRQMDKVGSNRTTLLRKIKAIRGAELRTCGFAEISPAAGDVVYLDPPYAGTTGYKGTGSFDSAALWATAERWSAEGVRVFVSEFDAPPGWAPVWSRTHTNQLRRAVAQTDALYAPAAADGQKAGACGLHEIARCTICLPHAT